MAYARRVAANKPTDKPSKKALHALVKIGFLSSRAIAAKEEQEAAKADQAALVERIKKAKTQKAKKEKMEQPQ